MIHIPILHRSRIVCQCHAALEEEIRMQTKQRLRHVSSYFDLKPFSGFEWESTQCHEYHLERCSRKLIMLMLIVQLKRKDTK